MKKKLLASVATLAVLAMGLVSCNNTPSGNSSSSSSSVSESTSSSTSSATSDTKIELNATATCEVGYTATIRARVTTSASNKTVTFTVDDDSVIKLPSNTTGSTITVTGLKEGTATLTATAVADPNVKATCVVTVTAAKPSLSGVFTNLQKLNNYTIHTVMEASDGTETVDELQVTDSAMVYTAETENGFAPVWTMNNTNVSRYGLQVLKTGEVVYLDYDANGKAVSQAERAKNSAGFLTKDNFQGNGNTGYGNENGLFVGIAGIYPGLFSSDKRSDNTYTVQSSGDEDYASVQAELILMKVFNNSMLQSVIMSVVDENGSYYLTDVTKAVDTTVKVLDNADIEVTFKAGEVTSTSTLTDVGTTEITNVPSTYAADVAAMTAITPELNEDLVAGVNALKQNNYMRSGSYTFTGMDLPGFTLNDYYTPNYFASSMLDLESYRNLVEPLKKKNIDLSKPEQVAQLFGSTVFYIKNDLVYARYVGYAGIADDGTADAHLTYSYSNELTVMLTQTEQMTSDYFYSYCGYVGESEALTNEKLYAFSEDTQQVFGEIVGFTTDSYEIGTQLATDFGLYDQIMQQYPDTNTFKTILDFKTDSSSGAVTAASIYICFSSDGNSYHLFEMALSNIGKATENPFDSDINSMIDGTYEDEAPVDPAE